MPSIKVSAIEEVLEQFRADLVQDFQVRSVAFPEKAKARGNCFDALVAWQRLEHRRIEKVPRQVSESPELHSRDLGQDIRTALSVIRSEFEHGEDLTQRLSRYFYRSDFNDFLYNNFGIHHIHLGARCAVTDKTKNHPMAGGASELLFAIVTPTEAYFLDVLDHQVFDNVEMTKSLVRVALRNRRDLLTKYAVPGVLHADQTFEAAFAFARGGFTTVYELDGVCFLIGDTVLDGRFANGTRKPCTNVEVIDAANHILNLVVDLLEYVQTNANDLANIIESDTGVRPVELRLSVEYAGRSVVIRENGTGAQFLSDGRSRGYRHSQSARASKLP